MSQVKRALEDVEFTEDDDLQDFLEEEEDEEIVEVAGSPPAADTEAAIEARYDSGQARIVIQRNDFLVPNILHMVENREILDLTPAYQRRARWNLRKKSHLIESLLMNVPIPPIFLYERDLAKYEVMDGQQRLSTIRSFFANEFPLRDLREWPELNGRRFMDLPPRIQAGLARRGVAAVIILTESGQDPATAASLRQYVFERLNTGGERLNAQEIRNCIYASPFNDMLIRVARSTSFTSAWGVPPKESGEPQKVSRQLATNRLYMSMADCEVVLRYFALKDLARFRSGLRKTLDSYMEAMRGSTKAECVQLEAEYLGVLDLARKVFGDTLFRLPGKAGELTGRRSVPLSDAVMLALGARMATAAKVEERKAEVLAGVQAGLADAQSYGSVVGRGNTKAAIAERIRILGEILEGALV